MTNDKILNQIKNISTWGRQGERAPHKPLLLLYALGRIQQGKQGMFSYQELEPKLKELLLDFGPPRKTIRPYYPFIRLANDGLWQFNHPERIDTSKDYSSKFLIQEHISAGFTPTIEKTLRSNSSLLKAVAEWLLENNFPETIHEDILSAVGLDLELNMQKKRDPQFRERVLIAYEYQCAVCRYSIRMGEKLVGVEAAHIKWHKAGGPDIEINGIALCSLHHKLFDLGVYTIDNHLRILVSEKVHGEGAQQWLIGFHGKTLRPPQSKSYYPEPGYLEWHVNEVFKGGYRKMQ